MSATYIETLLVGIGIVVAGISVASALTLVQLGHRKEEAQTKESEASTDPNCSK